MQDLGSDQPGESHGGSPAHESAARLLARCAEGDQSAWGALVRSYAGLVYSIARRAGLPEHLCDDVAQDVFGTLAKHLGSIRDPASLTAWLVTTTRRATIRAGRSAARVRAEPLGEVADHSDAALDDAIANAEKAHAVRAALSQLGGNCETLLRAMFFTRGDPDYREIARRLGIPVGSIGPTRARCLEKLAKILGPPE